MENTVAVPTVGCLALGLVALLGGCHREDGGSKGTPRSPPAAESPSSPPATKEGGGNANNSPREPQALHQAALDGKIAAVRRLLDAGAKAGDADRDGRTALMLAAFNGHQEIVGLLLDRGADAKSRDRAGRTALMYAASGPNPGTVELLVQSGSDVNGRDNGEGWTALMFAAAEGQAEVARTLLAEGADADITDADGDRAIDFARKNGHMSLVGLLGGEPPSK